MESNLAINYVPNLSRGSESGVLSKTQIFSAFRLLGF